MEVETRPKTIKATIRERKEIAEGTMMITYDLRGEEVQFRPGQYFFITIPKLLYPDDRGNRRHFSIVNSPNEHGIITMATRWRASSGFKSTLRDVPLGSEVEIGRIGCEFVLPDSNRRPITFIAGGIGITPFISMLRYVREEQLPYVITLLYSNRSRAAAAFFDELQEMDRAMPDFRLVLTMNRDEEWRGEKRTMDAQFIRDYVAEPNSQLFMIAGPPGMGEGMVKVLGQVGVEEGRVEVERFTGY